MTACTTCARLSVDMLPCFLVAGLPHVHVVCLLCALSRLHCGGPVATTAQAELVGTCVRRVCGRMSHLAACRPASISRHMSNNHMFPGRCWQLTPLDHLAWPERESSAIKLFDLQAASLNHGHPGMPKLNKQTCQAPDRLTPTWSAGETLVNPAYSIYQQIYFCAFCG